MTPENWEIVREMKHAAREREREGNTTIKTKLKISKGTKATKK